MGHKIGDHVWQRRARDSVNLGIGDILAFTQYVGISRHVPHERNDCHAGVFPRPCSPTQTISVIRCRRIFDLDISRALDNRDLGALLQPRLAVPVGITKFVLICCHKFLPAGVGGVVKFRLPDCGIRTCNRCASKTHFTCIDDRAHRLISSSS